MVIFISAVQEKPLCICQLHITIHINRWRVDVTFVLVYVNEISLVFRVENFDTLHEGIMADIHKSNLRYACTINKVKFIHKWKNLFFVQYKIYNNILQIVWWEKKKMVVCNNCNINYTFIKTELWLDNFKICESTQNSMLRHEMPKSSYLTYFFILTKCNALFFLNYKIRIIGVYWRETK